MRSTVGYMVVNDALGPMARCVGCRGLVLLCAAGGRNRYATVFGSREEAKTMILANREYRRHNGHPDWDRVMRIVRLAK